MSTVRRATIDDVPWLFTMCEEFAHFYGSKISLAGNPVYGKAFLTGLIEKHFVMVGIKDGLRVGFIAGMVGPHHFNPDIIQLTELLWWVKAEARNTGVGMKLFDAFMHFGETECHWITFTLEHNSPVNDKFLIKRGFREAEKAYLREC